MGGCLGVEWYNIPEKEYIEAHSSRNRLVIYQQLCREACQRAGLELKEMEMKQADNWNLLLKLK